MPSGVASPACSAIVQQFLRGRSASNPSRNPRTRPRSSIRPNRPAIRSASSSTPAVQPAGPTLARATTAGPSDVLTPDDGYAVAALVSRSRSSDLRLEYKPSKLAALVAAHVGDLAAVGDEQAVGHRGMLARRD